MKTNRLNAIRTHMKRLNMDHVIMTSPDSLYYLLEVDIDPGERMLALHVNATHCTLFISALFPIPETFEGDTVVFTDTMNPVALLAEQIGDNAVVGVDKFWAAHFLLKLMALKPDCTFTVGSEAVDAARLCKDSDELKRLEAASLVNDAVIEEVMASIEAHDNTAPLTEREVQRWVVAFNEKRGVHALSFTPTVCFGKNGAEPHHESDDTVLKSGDAIVVDIGGRLDGYCSDMTRSFCYGSCPEGYEAVYELVRLANEKAAERVAPGVPLKEIDAAARSVIEAAGYGAYFTHRTGHGIGICVHEFPDVSAASDAVCQVGMVFSIEPGIYLEGRFGVRIEDLIQVTESGGALLNHTDRSLRILKAGS